MRTQSDDAVESRLPRPPQGTLLATAAAPAAAPEPAAPAPGGDAVNVLMVNNPQMVELQKLTAEHFTKETGIKVNFTVLPENDVRDKISQDFANQAGQYDVATISNYEVPIYAKNGWLHAAGRVRRRRTPPSTSRTSSRRCGSRSPARTASSTPSPSTASRPS